MQIDEFKLEHFFERHEFSARYLLSSSDAETLDLAELVALADDEMRDRWNELRLGYTEVRGDPLLRAAVADLYDEVDPEQVLMFAGAQEAIFAAMNVLVRRGDHVLVVTPTYQSLHSLSTALGATVTKIELNEGGDWSLDLDAVRAAIRPETTLIVANVPNSPTGSLPSRATFDGLIRLARDSGAKLFLDEVYRFLEFDPGDRLPAAADADASALSLGVLSKSFGLAGLRVGWIATRDPEIYSRLVSFKHYLTICNAAPSEVLATIALRAPETVLARVRGIVGSNLSVLDGFMQRRADLARWVRPKAGTVGFVELLAPTPVDMLAEDLAHEEGVMLLPGSIFDHPGNYFRVGFGRVNMPDALERLESFLDRVAER
ncbi:MAG: aminotransferase class I/II-fold pyridoxal phosphate-dependent enzyme [Actinomycetota bacterium]|nr:aminotransferase class I/II-fold pyridoxal phosphate-dependent enzyme [Actinomycetota bacterium]